MANYGKAIAYEKLNKINEAIEQLNKAVALTKDNVDYRLELARLYFNRGVAAGPVQPAAENITTGTKPAQDLSVSDTASVTIKKNEDIAAAEQLFLSVTKTDKNHANAFYSLAMLYQKIGELENAKLAIKQLLTIATDQPSIDTIKKQFPGLY